MRMKLTLSMIAALLLLFIALVALTSGVQGAGEITPTQAPGETCENDPGMSGCPTWTPNPPTPTTEAVIEPYPPPVVETPNPYPEPAEYQPPAEELAVEPTARPEPVRHTIRQRSWRFVWKNTWPR